KEYRKRPSPRYLLLVGDSTAIPPFMRSTHPDPTYQMAKRIPTDLYYSTLDGDDILPDILVGRLPARSKDELSVMIGKILTYGTVVRSNAATASWGGMVVTAEYENESQLVNGQPRTGTSRWFHQTAYNIGDFVTRSPSAFSRVQQFYVARSEALPKPWYNRDGSEVPATAIQNFVMNDAAVRAIHDGWASTLRLVLHRDHGYRSSTSGGWATPSFAMEQVAQLPPPSLAPVVLSINCETGWYDFDGGDDHSLALSLMRSR